MKGNILITGGTSGLGLELVKLFLHNGFYVVITGRKSVNIAGFEDKFRFYLVDFSNLGNTASVIKEICDTFNFDLVINNAGILSPPYFIKTDDGYEYTYQVNFLSHLLINEIIIQHHNKIRPLKIAAVTSTAYRIAIPNLKSLQDNNAYRPFKAYSNSKLYLVLMCRHLSVKYHDRKIYFLSFDPGVFSSGIYRMQSELFRKLYKVASPFMKKPTAIARVLSEILTGSNIANGAVYDIKKRIRNLPEIEPSVAMAFWNETFNIIVPYLR